MENLILANKVDNKLINIVNRFKIFIIHCDYIDHI